MWFNELSYTYSDTGEMVMVMAMAMEMGMGMVTCLRHIDVDFESAFGVFVNYFSLLKTVHD